MPTSIASSAPPIWRSVGFWLVLVMGLIQAVYSARAFVDPEEFAVYRGTALAAVADAEWVRIYASRTLFVALTIGFLLVRRDLASLKWIALLGIVMPASDALLAFQSGASSAVVGRHVATIVYLLLTYAALQSWTKRNPAA
jgi:hypothetical protein